MGTRPRPPLRRSISPGRIQRRLPGAGLRVPVRRQRPPRHHRPVRPGVARDLRVAQRADRPPTQHVAPAWIRRSRLRSPAGVRTRPRCAALSVQLRRARRGRERRHAPRAARPRRLLRQPTAPPAATVLAQRSTVDLAVERRRRRQLGMGRAPGRPPPRRQRRSVGVHLHFGVGQRGHVDRSRSGPAAGVHIRGHQTLDEHLVIATLELPHRPERRDGLRRHHHVPEHLHHGRQALGRHLRPARDVAERRRQRHHAVSDVVARQTAGNGRPTHHRRSRPTRRETTGVLRVDGRVRQPRQPRHRSSRSHRQPVQQPGSVPGRTRRTRRQQ